MNIEQYKNALKHIKEDIDICSEHSLDDDGRCICWQYPCWQMVAREAIEQQLKRIEE